MKLGQRYSPRWPADPIPLTSWSRKWPNVTWVINFCINLYDCSYLSSTSYVPYYKSNKTSIATANYSTDFFIIAIMNLNCSHAWLSCFSSLTHSYIITSKYSFRKQEILKYIYVTTMTVRCWKVFLSKVDISKNIDWIIRFFMV